jgi:hypothetical protein
MSMPSPFCADHSLKRVASRIVTLVQPDGTNTPLGELRRVTPSTSTSVQSVKATSGERRKSRAGSVSSAVGCLVFCARAARKSSPSRACCVGHQIVPWLLVTPPRASSPRHSASVVFSFFTGRQVSPAPS